MLSNVYIARTILTASFKHDPIPVHHKNNPLVYKICENLVALFYTLSPVALYWESFCLNFPQPQVTFGIAGDISGYQVLQ